MKQSSLVVRKRQLFTGVLTLIVSLLHAHSAKALDRDNNGVDDAIEDSILTTFAPIYKTDEGAGSREVPPVSIDWYVRHCMISRWGGFYSGSSALTNEILPRIAENFTLTLDYFNNNLGSYGEVGSNTLNQPYSGFWRLWFKYDGNHWGDDPTEPRSWAIAQQNQDVLYGRVNRFGFTNNQFVVQYYLFFPWNDIDDTRYDDCPAGNHEGDISCAEYLVEFNSISDHRIIQAIYHEHGRQVFAEPWALQYMNGHPVIFPERENHENLPWAGNCGIVQGAIPLGIAANRNFPSHDALGDDIAGECDDAPVVRDHYGLNSTLQVSTIKNLHEKGAPIDMYSPEALFVSRYAGLYGHYANDNCEFFILSFFHDFSWDFDAPPGPPFQGKMWDRSYRINDVWVSLGSSAVFQNGDQSMPVSSIARAIFVSNPNATIHVNAGNSTEQITLSLPVTITAEGGTVTIGQ